LVIPAIMPMASADARWLAAGDWPTRQSPTMCSTPCAGGWSGPIGATATSGKSKERYRFIANFKRRWREWPMSAAPMAQCGHIHRAEIRASAYSLQ
jgi:hypothetical protein